MSKPFRRYAGPWEWPEPIVEAIVLETGEIVELLRVTADGKIALVDATGTLRGRWAIAMDDLGFFEFR